MKNIILKFIGVGYNNVNQAKVYIYDKNNCLIKSGYTCNGLMKVCLCKNKGYYVIATLCNEKICKYFYVNNNDIYVFVFNHSYINTSINRNLITFLLHDANYTNLPIAKGEINLWQKQ